MEFRQIRYAVAVGRERSFTKAAKRLNISQSAVSEQVRMLEDQLGFALFNRTGRGIELTDRGRSFLYEAERVVGEVLSLSDTAARIRGTAVDQLVVGMGSGISDMIIPGGLSGFSEIFPGVRLEVHTVPTRRIYNLLHQERLDVGIALEVEPDRLPAGLQWERLVEIEMVLIAPRQHKLASANEPVDLTELVSEPIIMNELTVGYGELVQSMFTSLGIRPDIRAISDNVETMRTMVAANMGVAIVPRVAAAGADIAVRTISPQRSVAISIVRRRQAMSRNREAYYAYFRDALMSQHAGTPSA
ncbi:MAG: LysR family transcriptional regulator [Alphaproteobacteria bacterium]|nr:LysR family transcriptional regulator [Alphaproteobacteria bacterium]MCZ6509387.1 LysR family transcriptional regulator [Alphaproteobacteria bacterium]MCZ6589197.1 LysR family transcriptional regulator [Alphaproteobacteria bacterium]MCZ6591800.1 LysR family transcriptional regulator [Alphaproteobacteria bacterium]MCZ6838933.1 LysR family transcriptional regulator [Alphaproteobacteria bacterium]